MRILFTLTLIFAFAHVAFCDEQDADAPVPWQAPFESTSASQVDGKLVLILITNEDPFVVESVAEKLAERHGENPGQQTVNPPVWCSDVLAHSYRRAIARRPDLKGRLSLQSISAGLPSEVTGGKSKNLPSRAVLACCDANYRLLGMLVGVPDVDDLLTLIEDSEGVAAMRQLQSERPAEVVNMLAQRSSERLNRAWRGALEEVLMAIQGDAGDDRDESGGDESFPGRLRLLRETFEPTYVSDVRLRFGLTESSDHTRLVILEQHIQTRRPWCEAMIPFVAGSDFYETWRELVESLWGHQPVTADAEAPELVDWFKLQTESDSVVLSILPPPNQRHLPWPPIVDNAIRRGIGWQDAHQLALEHPFRQIDAEQLAVVIRSCGLKPIDIHLPSTARYLFIEPNKKLPLVIRETDPPGRFAGLLKRSKSNLVSD